MFIFLDYMKRTRWEGRQITPLKLSLKRSQELRKNYWMKDVAWHWPLMTNKNFVPLRSLPVWRQYVIVSLHISVPCGKSSEAPLRDQWNILSLSLSLSLSVLIKFEKKKSPHREGANSWLNIEAVIFWLSDIKVKSEYSLSIIFVQLRENSAETRQKGSLQTKWCDNTRQLKGHQSAIRT